MAGKTLPKPKLQTAGDPRKIVKFSAYTKALREAGVGEDDLRLLRELAEMNAGDLERREEQLPSSRIRL
jgi:hypothetical protein